MDLQIVSDIHLEFYKSLKAVPLIEPKAPILVLAGDVGYPGTPLFWEFMTRCSQQFKHVLFVFGNHEYYNSETRLKKGAALSMESVEELVKGMIDHKGLTNIHVLQKSAITLEGIRFIGATLWSPIPPEQEAEVTASLSDYRVILKDNETPLDVEDVNRLHEEHATYIRSVLAEPSPHPTVVITHHLPSMALIAEKYVVSSVNCAFASTLLEDLEAELIPRLWISGHTHTGAKKVVRGCRCILNPWGYPGENRRLEAIVDTVIEKVGVGVDVCGSNE
jgi:predicted phosphodiesterase